KSAIRRTAVFRFQVDRVCAQQSDPDQQWLQRTGTEHHVGTTIQTDYSANDPQQPERGPSQEAINQSVPPQQPGDNSAGAHPKNLFQTSPRSAARPAIADPIRPPLYSLPGCRTDECKDRA